MAARYWVGGGSSTDWAATGNTNWSATSGGANNASVPTTSDDVFFDANSGSGSAVINAAANCLSATFTGFTGTLTHNAFTWTIVKSLTMVSGMTYTPLLNNANCRITFNGTAAGNTITTAGKALPTLLIFGSGGEWTLQDSITTQNATITSGTFNANNFNCDFNKITTGTSAIINMGSGTWTISGLTTSVIINPSTTLNVNTSTIVLSNTGNSTKTIDFGSKTLYNLTLNANVGASHEYYFISDLTVTNNMIINGANKLDFTATSTVTVNNLTINTTSTNIVYLFGDDPLVTQWNLVGNGGIYGFSYLDITDSNATNGTWNNTNGTDSGDNTGWNFLTSPVVAGTTLFSLVGKTKRVFKEFLVKSYKPLSKFDHKY